MQKNQNIFLQEFRNRPFAYGVQVAGIILILLNFWLGTKLLPMVQNLDKIITRVNAMEVDVADLQSVSKDNQVIVVKLNTLEVKVDDIQSRIQRIDDRLAKHMGI
jgi:hypothetical protein